jgi:RNA polymerase sigma-70 factor (ECF subfamily)
MAGRGYAESILVSSDVAKTDEDLMRDLAGGRHEALGPLYGRYAGLVFHLGVQSLDKTAAEELVQEVFLTIWRGAGSFDATQGLFRPWLLRLAHWKILNELRRRRRQPHVEAPTDEADPFEAVADREPGPEEHVSQTEYQVIVKAALEALPPKQRQAIAMAFLEDMTHEQVARALDVPLGTAKTRIRSGLQLMRVHLAPIAASLFAVALTAVGVRDIQTQLALEREQRAVKLVTTSDAAPLRLTPAAAGVPAGAHANYRGRPGVDLAVLSTELLPPLPPGWTYQAWVRHGETWTSLGTLVPDQADGSAQVVAKNAALTTPPEAIEITLEPGGGSQSPTGQLILAWPTP